MKRLLHILFILISFVTVSPAQNYLFYLHGRIVEDQGANAVDKVNGFGAYQYNDIIKTLQHEGFVVISECRKPNTDVKAYAAKVVGQIDSLMKKGVKPGAITVVGASKGSMIAMNVSSLVKNEKVNYVFMAGCSDYTLQSFPGLSFCGNILSIYEESDDMGRSCNTVKSKSTLAVPHYKEIELHTGLRHGFLYKPLPEWIKPVAAWGNGKYE